MSKSIAGDPTTAAYWDDRVRSAPNRQDMLFLDGRREEYWRRVRFQLGLWAKADVTVLDVACGFGQFANLFTPAKYRGIDFSAEMLRLAEETHPQYPFEQMSAHDVHLAPGAFDVIFEVNSLRSLGMTADDFIKRFLPYANVAVACLEADRFTIENIYYAHR